MKGLKKLNYQKTHNKGQYSKNGDIYIMAYNDGTLSCNLFCNVKDNKSIERMQKVLRVYLHDLQDLQEANKEQEA